MLAGQSRSVPSLRQRRGGAGTDRRSRAFRAALAVGLFLGTAAAAGRGGQAAESMSTAELLPVGARAPEFSALAHDGRKIDLGRLKGKYVVIYFYPMDDSPGCTIEASDFRDSWARLLKRGVVVLGVSTQDSVSHQAFAKKYRLPFSLLPDAGGEIAAKYKVPVVNGVARRVTYLIDKSGKVARVWPQVTPTGHAGEILAALPSVADVR
jgi:thioredoxin-dependent peroxiredoxin